MDIAGLHNNESKELPIYLERLLASPQKAAGRSVFFRFKKSMKHLGRGALYMTPPQEIKPWGS